MTKYPVILIIFLCLFQTFAQGQKKGGKITYADSILEQRKDKNTEFMMDKSSPLTDEDKLSFIGLFYYPPDPKFRVTATLTRFDNPFHFKMKTTTDRLPEYSLYGKIEFKIKGKKLLLNVYQNVDLLKNPAFQKYLFIPFNDATNGLTTYDGGRFLDAEIPEGNSMVVDFNLAYNPYCAYNHKYSCPIPPEDNRLDIKIEAGEKKWHH
jgi:uncharacterized protein (DUF1684 family)